MRASRQASPAPGPSTGARSPGKPDGPQPLSVSAFAKLIERAVGESFPQKVTVRGEVSGARHRTHFYFSLKDEDAVIGAVMFASAAKRSPVAPADGRTVIATGKLEYYAPQGRLSLIVESLKEDGEGSLEARFRALCDELRSRGWFDPAAKKRIPDFPRRIAVLTASGSAALHDVLDTAKQRCPAVELVLIDVPVQGERAAPTIARTIRNLGASARRLGIDAILVTRGGGSVEDLWAFNDPDLAAAIHACPVPLVAAIGHESDTTIAELVADHRAATPTQATVRLTPDRAALARQLDSLDARRARSLRTLLDGETRRLDALARRPVMADPAAIVGIQRDRLAGLARALGGAAHARLASARRDAHALELRLERHRPHAALARRRDEIARLERELHAAARSRLAERRRTVEGLAGVLRAIDPTAVLERGYSITTREDGSVLRDPPKAGTRILTRLAGGRVGSVVESEDGSLPAQAPPAAPHAESDPKPAPSAPSPAASKPSVGKPATRKKPAKKTAASDDPNAPQLDLFGG